MPRAQFPTTLAGWFVVILASLVGFAAGFLTISILGGRFG